MNTDRKVWDWRSYIINYAPKNSTYRHVLLTLSCFMDSAGGSCFPSIEKLSECTSLSKPSVIKYLNKAEEDGWIKKSIHGFNGQGWKRNEYTASIPEKVVKEVNHEGGKGGKPHRKGGKPDTKKVVKEVNSISSSNNSPVNSLLVQGVAFDERSKISDIITQVDFEYKPITEEESCSLLVLHIWKDVNDLKPNNQITLKAKLKSWHDPVRLMVQQDKRTVKEIWDLWKWIRKDAFWKINILSTDKLREQFDHLSIKSKNQHNGSNKQQSKGNKHVEFLKS